VVSLAVSGAATIGDVRIAMVASECEPFAKTGGLADVVDALARALGRLGHEVEVFLPLYRGVQPPPQVERLSVTVPRGSDPARSRGEGQDDGPASIQVVSGQADGYRIRLVEHAPSFDRPDLYTVDGRDYPDNGARFSLLGRAMLETLRTEARPPDVIHGHDWQSGPALLLQRHRYADDPTVGGAGSLLTCHNLAYHGWVPQEQAWQLDLPASVGSADGVDLLREAIATADLVNTVSPTYAMEARTPEYGAGLDDLLRALGDGCMGILNGLDTELWDPATDRVVAANFSADDLSGKSDCRADLAGRHGLDLPGGAPLLGMVGRLDPQKGFDLVTGAAEELLRDGARIIVLGTGDHALLTGLKQLAAGQPDRLVVLDRFDRDEARRIYAGSDIFLMPSRFEPCGQGQMIALRYGTLPLVRRTGGLADTVFDADADPEHGNGFVFEAATPAALLEAARRAIRAYSDRERWLSLQRRGMVIDWSWRGSAQRYVAAYERALSLRRAAAS
jgi:starch synthase